MATELENFNLFSKKWIAALAEYNYKTAEDFLSTCRVETGRTALANVMGCSEAEVEFIEKKLIAILGPEASPAPFDPPPGGVITDNHPGGNNKNE